MKNIELILMLNIIKEKKLSIKERIEYLSKADKNFQKNELFIDFETARTIIFKTEIKDSEKVSLLIEIGKIHFELDRFEQTVDFLENSFQHFNDSLSYKKKTEILEKLGILFDSHQKLDEAKSTFQNALLLSEIEENIKDIIYFSNSLGDVGARRRKSGLWLSRRSYYAHLPPSPGV